MKIKSGFMLREVAGSYIVVAVGNACKEFKGMITLNESGAFLWKELEAGKEVDEIVKDMLDTYEGISNEKALEDANMFINKLKENKILE